MARIYLDYASTTPIDPAVLRAMQPYLKASFGNPSSLHSYGQSAMGALDKARQVVAESIGAKFSEIIFTASATEANNLALRGVISGFKNLKFKPRLIISAIEHESILETAKDLKEAGADVVYVPVDKNGQISLEKLKEAINETTVLVSIMYANNEIGTIQPIAEVAKIIREYKETRKDIGGRGPLLHMDAVQAFQYLDCNVDSLHVDMMTLSSHKIYGPKGAACLYVRNLDDKGIKPILFGGGQEFGYRSGTENIPAIVGFAEAVQIAIKVREREWVRVEKLRDYMWAKIKSKFKKAQMNGGMNARLPNNINLYTPEVIAEDFIVRLDLAGVAVSSGSACASRALQPSHVIKSLGFSDERARNSIRITLGKFTSKIDIDKALRQILK